MYKGIMYFLSWTHELDSRIGLMDSASSQGVGNAEHTNMITGTAIIHEGQVWTTIQNMHTIYSSDRGDKIHSFAAPVLYTFQ